MKTLEIILIIGVSIITVGLGFVISTSMDYQTKYENPLLQEEVINGTYIVPENDNIMLLFPTTIPFNGTGLYHIDAATTQRGQVFLIGFAYKTYERDRFGQRTEPTNHGWNFPPVRTDYGYLGGTDDYSVLDVDFTIPENGVDSVIKILSTTGGRVNITVTKKVTMI